MAGKSLNILMTTDTIGGVWNYSLTLCKALQDFGITIHLAAMGGLASANQREETAHLNNVILYESNYKLEWMENPWEDINKAHLWLHNLYLQIQPDLIHLNNFAKLHQDWMCPVITVYHSCVATWWKAVKNTAIPDTWSSYIQQLTRTTKASQMVVAPSRAMLEQARSAHSLPWSDQVIYNSSYFSGSPGEKKENFIFCIGRIWDEAKNLHIVAEIAKNLPWPVYIAGNNQDPNTGKNLHLENVTLLGQLSVKEVQQWMKRASIFISPSKYEPFGLGILEAARATCAVVLSRIKSLQEIWGPHAVYFDPDNITELREAIHSLIEDKEKRQVLGRNAFLHSQKYRPEKQAKEYMMLYQKLIQKKTKNQKINSL